MQHPFIIKTLILAVSIFITGKITRLYEVNNFYAALGAAFLLAVSNAVIRPILLFFTLPITIITLGIFVFFLNGFILLMVLRLFKGFKIDGCLSATIAYIIISVISWFLNLLLF